MIEYVNFVYVNDTVYYHGGCFEGPPTDPPDSTTRSIFRTDHNERGRIPFEATIENVGAGTALI
jgi:hypothetical protein